MPVKIRSETSSDVSKIHQVIESAFREAPHTDHTEQHIVEALRESGALVLSQVAEVEGVLVGHAAVSAVGISDGATHWYGLGPISIVPEYQGQGVGSRLMEATLADVEAMNASGCVVLGDPGYYKRFGFEVVDGLVFPGVPRDYFMALSFGADFAQGEVSYHEAFSVQCQSGYDP